MMIFLPIEKVGRKIIISSPVKCYVKTRELSSLAVKRIDCMNKGLCTSDSGESIFILCCDNMEALGMGEKLGILSARGAFVASPGFILAKFASRF